MSLSTRLRSEVVAAGIGALATILIVIALGYTRPSGPSHYPTFTATATASPIDEFAGIWASEANVTVFNHTGRPQRVNQVVIWFPQGLDDRTVGTGAARCPWYGVGDDMASTGAESATFSYLVIPAHGSETVHLTVLSESYCAGAVPNLAATAS